MHPVVFRAIEEICETRNAGGAVLEIGALPSDKSLLCMPALRNATSKHGIDLKGPFRYADFEVVRGNANEMSCFEDERFDTVLCNAVFEHDPYFWRSLSEIRRVTKRGGLVVIGTPGFAVSRLERYKDVLNRIPLFRGLARLTHVNALFTATLTFQVHNAPGDYYRFSEQAFREVLLEGMTDIQVRTVMSPPRIIGSGIKA